MNKTFTTAILILFSLSLFAQRITLLDETNLQPIEQVMVFNQNQDKYTISDTKGEADISIFNKRDTLFFQHASYKVHSIEYGNIELNKAILLIESMLSISEVIIAANKWEQERSEISNKITTIKPKDIELQNPQTTADILASTGEVFVQKSQLGGGSPMIRGFATNAVLMVVDGVRLNNAIYRQGNLQNVINLDAHVMDGSEILFGPGSVIYGSDALGGVMDFHTRKPLLSSNEKILIKTNALARYSSANNENTGHIDIIIANKQLSSVTSFSYSNYGDLKMGTNGNNNSQYLSENYVKRENGVDSVYINDDKNIQLFSGFNQFNAMQKLRYKPNDVFDMEYAFHYSQSSDIPRYDALRQTKDNAPKYAEWNYGPQKWQMHSLSLHFNLNSKLADELKFITAFQNYKESRITRKLNDFDRLTQNENVNILSSNIDFNKKLNENVSIFYGVEFIYNGLESVAETKDVDTGILTQDWSIPRYPDGDNNYYSSAIYTGTKIKLHPKVVLNAGLRYSYVSISSTFVNQYYSDFGFDDSFENKNGALNGSLGVAFTPNDNLQVNGNLSSGFQAPNWDGLGKVFTPKKGVVIVPNQELTPQYAYNAELGVIQYFFNKSASIEMSGFYTLINDPIVQGDYTLNGMDSLFYDGEMNKVQASINVDNATIYGANLSINANLTKSFGFKSHLSYTFGEDNTGERLRHVAPIFGSTHLLYQKVKLKADLYAMYNGYVNELPASEADKDYMYALNNDATLYSPSWYTLNFKVSYQIHKNLQLNAGIENILDVRYRPYASGIVSPGRNYMIALRFKV